MKPRVADSQTALKKMAVALESEGIHSWRRSRVRTSPGEMPTTHRAVKRVTWDRRRPRSNPCTELFPAESRSSYLSQSPQSVEILSGHGGAGLDLDTHQLPGWLFQHEIHLGPVDSRNDKGADAAATNWPAC